MEIVALYALTTSGIFLVAVLFNIRFYLTRIIHTCLFISVKYLVYPQILRRHHYLGPWSRASILLHLTYLAVNVFCLTFKVPSVRIAGLRAGNLALFHLVPLIASPHLTFLADLVGLNLSSIRRLHRAVGVMSGLLQTLHVLVMVAVQAPISIHMPQMLWGVIGVSSLCILLAGSYPLFRRASYEVFLRAHQVLTALVVYSVWRHVASRPFLPLLYVYAIPATFFSTLLLQCALILYRNLSFDRGCTRASIQDINGSVQIRLSLSRPLKLDAGQYINLWIPSVSSRSFLQSHPFVVTSWSEEKQSQLDLYIKPRQGWTHKLLDCCKADPTGDISRVALFSGPHGKTAKVENYETVLMVASGYGIVTQMPYLKQLIHGYNTCKTRTRRVHLVWQIETIDIAISMENLLNDALEEDILDDGYILTISVFIERGLLTRKPYSRRAIADCGTADFERILQEESAGKHIKRMEGESEDQGKMLVMVSSTNLLRDQLRSLVRKYLDNKVELLELEYQPD